MNKTISIHIKGFPFIMEEIAFNRLQNYMERLKSALKNQQGADEIIDDIEYRIAELLNDKKTNANHVLIDNDIVDVLNTLGDPKEYADNNDETVETEESYNANTRLIEKKLFRDVESKYIGGVCAGLGNYFGIDPTIIRVIWLLAFLIGGMGFLLYILLWIIIPGANTPTDRLKMHGKPINVDTVKEEVERVAKNVTDKSKQFANQVRQGRFNEGASTLKRLIKVVIACFLLFIGISATIAFISAIIGSNVGTIKLSDNTTISAYELSQAFFDSTADSTMAWAGAYLTAISIITFCFLAGIVLLFNLKNKWYRYTNLCLVLLGTIGIIITTVPSVRAAKDFTQSGELEKELATFYADELSIIPYTAQKLTSSDYVVKEEKSSNFKIEGNTIYHYGIDVRYFESKDSLFHIKIEKSARGRFLDKALKRAENIEYDYSIDSNLLKLRTFFTYDKMDKFRNQDVVFNIYVPEGKTVSVNHEKVFFKGAKETIVSVSNDDDDVEISVRDKRNFNRGKILGDGSYR